jgi:molecular chaperone GrpE
MFFKKRKPMNTQDNHIKDESEQPHITEEQMAQGLNIDENMAGTELLNDELTDGNDDQGKELAEARDKYLRLAAEFDNYKRRTAKERVELIATAGKEIIQSMLDVLDDSERATKQLETSDDIEKIKEGVVLVFNKLKNTLHQKGLKAMESHGEEFNADLHEAITEIPAPSEAHIGKIVDVIQPGYYLNDKLIRHAKVVVGK